MKMSPQSQAAPAVIGWGAAAIMFFPIFWMFLTSFKTEIDAISSFPSIFFSPTLENYERILSQSDYLHFAANSVFVAMLATAISLGIGIPAAYAMAYFPTDRTRGTMLWILSTKMMPPVGVLVPTYLMYRDLDLIDTRTGLIVLYTLMNLPVVIWMLFSFFREVPKEILEAARIDGVTLLEELWHILLPLSLPGILSTALLSIVLCWNEAFWSLNLTTTDAAPLTAFIASYSAPQGLFWAKLSAASTLAVGPILILGWFGQKHLVRGLTFGAVK